MLDTTASLTIGDIFRLGSCFSWMTKSLKASHGGRRYAPLAFTEHGAIMASMVLNSPRATELSIYVVQAFVELRSMLATNREVANKLHLLERKVSKHDQAIGELVNSIRQLLAPPESPKRPIGFVTPEDTPKPTAPNAAKNANGFRKR